MTQLIEITEATHGAEIMLAYATPENFTGKPVYKRTACFLHPDAEEKLRIAIDLAARQGLKLRIYDAFRPAEVQQMLWDHTPDPEFLAHPERGSPHSRGVAVDLTLLNQEDQPFDMGTPFDSFEPASHHGVTSISVEAQRNRFLLMGIMMTAGWDFYRNEWWHYQLFNARQNYPVLNDKEAGTNLI